MPDISIFVTDVQRTPSSSGQEDLCLQSHKTICILSNLLGLRVWFSISLNPGADLNSPLWNTDSSWHTLNYRELLKTN